MTAWRDAPTLTGRHVALRPLLAADHAALCAVLAPLRGQFTTVVPETPDDPWFAKLVADTGADRMRAFAVLDPAGAIVGTTRYMRMAEAHRRLEIGGTLYAPQVQRTGLNTEAKRLLLEHAFDRLGCNVVQLRTDWFNRRSRTAIERLGAKLDGVLRGHLVMADGHIRDTAVYSIVASEWPGVRANLNHLLARYGEAS